MLSKVCLSRGIAEAIGTVRIIIVIIMIVAPITLMFSVIFKLIKASYHRDNYALEQAIKGIGANVKATVLLFMVPFLVNIILALVPDSPGNCIDDVNDNTITESRSERVKILLSRAEESLNVNDYNILNGYIKKIKDNSISRRYENELVLLKEKVYIKNAKCIKENNKIVISSKLDGKYIKDIYVNNIKTITTKENEITMDNTSSEIRVSFNYGEDITCTRTQSDTGDSGTLKIYFLGLGRFDGFLIIGNGSTLFIDGGYVSQGKVAVDFIKKLGITKIDGLIGSHLHNNHIDAHREFVKQMQIGRVYYGEDPSTCIKRKTCIQRSSDPTQLMSLIEKNNIPMTILTPGLNTKVENLTFDIVAPEKLVSGSGYPENNNSLNMILKFGDTKIYFSGDHVRSNEILQKYDKDILDVDIFKWPHHGLESVSNKFLDAVSPEYIIIPNSNKPAPATKGINYTKAVGYSLDKSGYVLAESDGTTLTVTKYKYEK